jgi:hypothetical protein
MRQAPEAPENGKDFQRLKVFERILCDGVMVCPGIFQLMGELLYGRNALCIEDQKPDSRCCQTTH